MDKKKNKIKCCKVKLGGKKKLSSVCQGWKFVSMGNGAYSKALCDLYHS